MKYKNLASAVEDVKSTTDKGRPLTSCLEEVVLEHDRNRCVAEFALDVFWDENTGNDLWGAVVFVWRNSPEFFAEYDTDIAIIEDPAEWTPDYFAKQRNSLRQDFSLERLCHLVMVYEHLHETEFNDRRPAPAQSERVQSAVPVRRSGPSVERNHAPRRAPETRRWHWCALGVCVVLVVVAILLFLSYQAEWRTAPDAKHVSDGANPKLSGGRNE